ncbi:response regulator [Edaphovirga cremea]|uniref:hybrid sensor histidine kinase/response regulator n=1 Tax=Edaphovirga cremea TaxID=2267246 RepID=UPI003988C38F
MLFRPDNHNKEFTKTYIWATILGGGAVYFLAAYGLDLRMVDLRFLFIVALTLFVSSRIVIKIPQFSSHISVSDTFIFLTLLLYGGEAAILMASTEALISSSRFCRKSILVPFNWGCAALSTCITVCALRFFFGDVAKLSTSPLSARFVSAMALMALIQYGANSGIVATCGALQAKKPIWQTWKKHYLWTSITYFAGASAAAVIAKLIQEFGFYALVITIPIIAIVFFTYRTYLKNIEASVAQAEQAERHVAELSHYIAEQERIREQFSQIEKLSALGELASGVAHDFNNTLAGILGRAQLIQRTNDPEKIMRGLNIIIKTAEDGAKTVKRIQDFARQRRDHDFEPVSIDQILLDVSEITRPRWKDRAEASNIQISLDLQIRSKAKVMGDESELREVLVNMVFNAVDAMPDGGQLTLAAYDIDESVVIMVADTGSGMAPEVKSRIFDPFFTTKGKAGMGLGLAVSFGIIRRHEGSVKVDSEVNMGTKFMISLPKAEVTEEANLPEVELAKAQPVETNSANTPRVFSENQPKILVVDDEEPVRELLRDLLEHDGCRVYLAPGSREALGLLEVHQFDGIFTDVGMPGMSGWELAHAIRQRNTTIPIAVVTGWGEAVGSDEQKEAGVDWVIAKPFHAEKISEIAREITRQREVAVKRAAMAIVAA